MAIVCFADILGFSALSTAAGAVGAVDALSDLAAILSTDNAVARYLQSPTWQRRYGLSDSLFLVADDPGAACAAAAEMFFNLAYYNSGASRAVLLRGALAAGSLREVGPLFPETATANLVGDAVVRAVSLEKSGPKGPRLLLSDDVAASLRGSRPAWLLDQCPGEPPELLWVLPPDPDNVDPLMVGQVTRAAGQLLAQVANDPQVAPHYVAYVDMVARGLERLRAHDADAFRRALQVAAMTDVATLLRSLAEGIPLAAHTASRLGALLDPSHQGSAAH